MLVAPLDQRRCKQHAEFLIPEPFTKVAVKVTHEIDVETNFVATNTQSIVHSHSLVMLQAQGRRSPLHAGEGPRPPCRRLHDNARQASPGELPTRYSQKLYRSSLCPVYAKHCLGRTSSGSIPVRGFSCETQTLLASNLVH